jgi:phage FluMu protein Com
VTQVSGRQGHVRNGQSQYTPARVAPRRRIWAPNGLRFRPMVCAWCGHHFQNEACERGYFEKVCPNCKAACEFHLDRTQEVRNYEAYAFQERQIMNLEVLPDQEHAQDPPHYGGEDD